MAGKRSLSPSPTQPLTKPPDRRITQPARRCLKSISTTFETQPVNPANLYHQTAYHKDLCMRPWLSVEARFRPPTLRPCGSGGQTGGGVWGYAIAGVCGLRVILFAALSRFCAMAAMTIWACTLARPKYLARCRPKRRFIVPKVYSMRKRRFEISRLKRFSDCRRGRPRAALRRMPSRYLPRSIWRLALLA